VDRQAHEAIQASDFLDPKAKSDLQGWLVRAGRKALLEKILSANYPMPSAFRLYPIHH
jgi:hypothetical protein